MPEEDVIGKLAAFSPAIVDRDALLFAAGRASVRPARGWKWATAALLATQLLTLVLWQWPKPPVAPSVAPSVVQPEPPSDPAEPPPDPYSLWALTHNPEPRVVSNAVPNPSRPPLLAFSRDFQP